MTAVVWEVSDDSVQDPTYHVEMSDISSYIGGDNDANDGDDDGERM